MVLTEVGDDTMTAARRPAGKPFAGVTVGVRTEQPLVRAGLMAMLGSVADRDGLGAGRDGSAPDVLLLDDALLPESRWKDPRACARDVDTTVIAVDTTLQPDLGARARASGIEWSISLDITRAALLAVIHSAATDSLETNTVVARWSAERYPGEAAGVSPREMDVLALVAAGLPNPMIAEELGVSINSIKTYIRSAYRKIGVTSRSQAVAWAYQAGLRTDH